MESVHKKISNANEVNVKKRNKPNIFSNIFMCWICPVLFNGNRREVEEYDLIVPKKPYDSDRLGDTLERYWLAEYAQALEQGRQPSLWKAMRQAYWLAYMPGGIYVFILAVSKLIQPMLFARLLTYWSSEQTITQLEAIYYALGMLGLNLLGMMCQHHNSLFSSAFSLRMKVACSAILYRKLLRMSQVSVGDVAAGKLVNLLSNDVARFDYAFMFLHYLWVVPLQVAAGVYFLWDSAGYAPIVGLFGVTLLVLPVQAALTNYTAQVRRQIAQRTDTRIKLMGEIVNGIQVIKMYAWEIPFQAVVEAVRAFEIKSLRKALIVRSQFIGFMVFTERLSLFLTSLILILSGTMVTANVIFPVQQFMSIIQVNLAMVVPLAIASLFEMFVALERMESFLILGERGDLPVGQSNGNNALLNSEEKSKEPLEAINIVKEPRQSLGNDNSVVLSEVSASWSGFPEITLKNISLSIRKGELCAIIGPVGCGKSSLLQVLLKELAVTQGTLNVHGRMSYACQESWLFSATVRENILFGASYDPQKYKEVCRACCLAPDFKQFPYGDLSLVGERGVSLSGGQRARINLARAIYREVDIYLLDDPLSAVDANVGRQLFEGCINGYLRGRTRVLVTHQIHFLKAADKIVILREGSVENVGSYEELSKSGKEFSQLLTSLQESLAEEESNKLKQRPSLRRDVSEKDTEDPEIQNEQMLQAEDRAKVSVSWEIIGTYLRSINSWCLVLAVLFWLTVNQGAAAAADYWLGYWTNAVSQFELDTGDVPDTDWDTIVGALTTAMYIGIYGGLIIAVILTLQVRIYIYVSAAVRASQNIHNKVFKNLIAAFMRFFDTNPSGRVLNRFSKDMGAMDELLPRSMLETLQMYFAMVSVLVLNALALPWTLIPTAALVVLFVMLLKWYLKAAQSVKRLEGTTKSPVFGMINSTIAGLSTIRSSNSEQRLRKTFDRAQDLHSSAFFTFIGGTSAFALYLDALCLVYLGGVLATFLLVDFDGIIPVGSVGLAVTQTLMLTVFLQLAARYTGDFLAHTTSVERVLEYSKLPTERNVERGPTQPPVDWPSKGQVIFDDVHMKYGPEDPYVLKNLSFTINSGWKVGVVGRTGAGKSSLISALFRLTDIEGTIKIDGVDTSGIAILLLRSKISIIPQEPVLFSATVRYNLDPFNVYSDDDIWRALEQVELKDAVPALDYKVTEGGSNFSVGQRQLMCLARAILRSNKILIMDEATANVDPQTDGLIQKTIRRVFVGCTVITIAHRLNTIMDSDRVLVMDKGVAVEFDYSHRLLASPSSHLSFMVRETGENMSRTLHQIAKDKYESDKHIA